MHQVQNLALPLGWFVSLVRPQPSPHPSPDLWDGDHTHTDAAIIRSQWHAPQEVHEIPSVGLGTETMLAATIFIIMMIYFVNWNRHSIILLLLLFIYLFWREGEGEKHQCVVASHIPSPGNLAHNPGMCSDWESNRRPFGSHARAQFTETLQPGLFSSSYKDISH